MHVVRGLLRGEVFCTAVCTPYAHLWRRVWGKLNDIGLMPVDDITGLGQIKIYKVASHQTRKEKEILLPAALQQALLNEAADNWAKQGADIQPQPAWCRK